MLSLLLLSNWKFSTEFGSSRKRTINKLFNERQASNKRIEDSREAFQVKVFYAAIDTGILQIKEGTVYGQLKKFRCGQEL